MGRKQTETTKEKIKKSLRLFFKTDEKEVCCLGCGKTLSSRKRKTQYCGICFRKLPKDDAFKERMSKIAKERNFGGITSKIRIWYKQKNGKEIWLQSSYEIEFAKILDKLNLNWERPEPLKWIDNFGKEHRYYPDFKVNGIYFDTKNDYLAIKDIPKIEAVKNKIK